MHRPVLPSTVHGEGDSFQCCKPLFRQVLSSRHRPYYEGEALEVFLLAAQKRLSLEKRNDSFHKVVAIANDEHKGVVHRAPMILTDPAAAEPLRYQVQDLTTLSVLAYVKLGYELPPELCARIPLNSNVK